MFRARNYELVVHTCCRLWLTQLFEPPEDTSNGKRKQETDGVFGRVG